MVTGDTEVHTGDALTLARIGAFLARRRSPVLLRYTPDLSFSELRENPAVLIGAFNNYWTMRLTGELRFRFGESRTNGVTDRWVEDKTDPGNRKWRVIVPPDGKVSADYAIVTRAVHPSTGRLSVVIGGLTYHATVAAGEFLTDPQHLRKALPMFPRGWEAKNLQVVLMTRIIGGSNGPPSVVAVHVW
jgi:hypothetical protein